MSEPLALPRHEGLRLAEIAGRGRGLITIAPIGAGTLIEAAPVLALPESASPARENPLFDYPFAWDGRGGPEAIAFGLVSMVNHDPDPNGRVEPDLPNLVIRLFARRDILPGEEITVDYAIPLWWEEGAHADRALL
ncbi:SET domain-containing protein-lysine N-methyltransferase [Arsenicitalea aurantiaca]|uniref:SET domain-containing protein-lysine N-methyltransferase n=1 Tax=Arsenicitalea aurantiaca TaxID=1783274 RepID=A0A433XK16_9HYPH|nr:SET domain-containing protein-lysine N-methyltransferase [Arsenicitalea aurantiaca]RUT34432.1 SET domain-containing protein-lysine N-methyltransferase [Arsenicitalea aurantiaca]